MQIIKVELSRIGEPEYKRILALENDVISGEDIELTGADVGLGENDILDAGSIIIYANATFIAYDTGYFRKKV